MADVRKIASWIPLLLLEGGRAKKVSIANRISNALFGGPNARRANGIVCASFDVCGAVSSLLARIFGMDASKPVYEIDRIGCAMSESLPRIWLSEKVGNTHNDDGRRVFVECYPSSPDRGGVIALELGDRYLGEGMNVASGLRAEERIECFQAAEILYRHATRRGNRTAASRLHMIYENDMCKGKYWKTYIEERAAHAKSTRSGRTAKRRSHAGASRMAFA